MAKKKNSLHDLFMDELMDAYDAEHQLIEALPKMAKAAHAPELRRGFEEHLTQTREQVKRIDQIFSNLGGKPNGKKCEGMQGIIKDGEKLLKEENVDPNVKDAGLIVAAQKAEHYEIATYGTLRTYADQLGMPEEARLLNTTLEEESKTNEKLNSLAINHINWEAQR
jgi:ferritin-like metal-binding protein YciE